MIDVNSRISSKVKELKPSGIRRFFDIANEMDGVVSLGIGEPDFKTPWAIRKAGIQSLEQGKTVYTANAGLAALREEIARYMKRRFDLEYDGREEILVTVGGSEAIDLGIRVFVEPGDEVLIPEPCFVAYEPIAKLMGGKVVPIPTREEDRFRLTPQALQAAITEKSKILILPYPNNPTGAVMRREDLEAIAQVIRESNLIVISDEIYAELTYGDQRHVSIAQIPGMRERTIVINGFSKAFSMTGWRLGFACAPKEITKQLLKIHQYAIMCSPTTSQYAGIVAVRECDDNIQSMKEEYDMRRRLIVDGFQKLGCSCFEPEGAFYLFPCIRHTGMTSEEFCQKLLFSQRVAVIPGDAFGASGEGYIRASYCYSITHITEALRRIRLFLEELGCLPQ